VIVKNDLFDYHNRFIYQDTKAFKFSLDSILLAEFAKNNIKGPVLDLCAGNMAVGLILSTYTKEKIIGFEIQESIYNLAIKSIKLNNLTSQLTCICDDVNNLFEHYQKESFSTIVCNPPYFKLGNNQITHGSDILKLARHEITLNLEQIFALSSRALVNKGHFYMVHRAQRMDEIFLLASKYNMNVKSVQLVSTKKDESPLIVLVKCVKNSNAGVKFANQLCTENLKTYQNIFKEI